MADAAIALNQPSGRRQRGPLNSAWTGYLLAGPALLVMIAIFVYPLGYSFVMSFFRWDLSAPSAPFIGLNNYKETLASPLFQQSLRNQLVFTAATIAVEITAGMGVAVLINGKLRGLRAARTLLLIPPMIAPAVVGLNFRWLFNSQYGFIDALLADLHLPAIPWLSDPNWALVSIIIADVWQNTPLMVLLFLAGLQSLPQEPLEAAAVDGASPWQIFWNITLPLMRPVIMVALMLRIIDTFRTFDVVWLMTQGGPGGATSLVTVHAYLLAFQGVDFGHAAAVSYIALVLSLAAARRPLRSPVAERDVMAAMSDETAGAASVEVLPTRRRPFPIGLAARYAVLIGTILLTIFPLVWLVITSLRSSGRYFRRSRAHHSGVHNVAPVRQCLHPVQSRRLPLEHGDRLAGDGRLRDGARCPLRLCDGAVPPALPSGDRLAACSSCG